MSDSGNEFDFSAFQLPFSDARMHPEGAPGEADALARRMLGDSKYEEVQERQRRLDQATVHLFEARAEITQTISRMVVPASALVALLALSRSLKWLRDAFRS